MPAILAEGKRPRPQNRAEVEGSVEVWEQRSTARGLPSQRRAQRFRGDRDQDEVLASGEVLGRCLLDGAGIGEMDVSVGDVDRRALVAVKIASRLPFLRAAVFARRLGVW